MKKEILIISTTILLSVSGNCQWYNRRYGINDINQLSHEQLNEALKKAKGGARTGAILSAVSFTGIISGILIASSADNLEEGGERRAYNGVFLVIGSVPIGLTGLTIWGINGTRTKRIKSVLKSTELKMGLVNCPCRNIFASSQGYLFPLFSITVRF